MLLCFFCFFSGLMVYCSVGEHLLSVLLSLEYMVIFVFLLCILSFFMSSFYYSLIYLIMAACEGALGLSILVVMSRTHGGDYFKIFYFLSN
uniref:NADH-ubiquinone oxidoreductase chain 4L n=1 Tax=Seira pallidipes TaxID=3053390 RepID=A0AAU6QDC7_9HEXA